MLISATVWQKTLFTTSPFSDFQRTSTILSCGYIQPFLKEHQAKLTLVYLHPYSPNLNMIEELWGWLKSSVIHNVFFYSVQKIRKAVQGFIRLINETPAATVERLCLKF